jgi:hypothetical protein
MVTDGERTMPLPPFLWAFLGGTRRLCRFRPIADSHSGALRTAFR